MTLLKKNNNYAEETLRLVKEYYKVDTSIVQEEIPGHNTRLEVLKEISEYLEKNPNDEKALRAFCIIL
jgi:hypothetical protein